MCSEQVDGSNRRHSTTCRGDWPTTFVEGSICRHFHFQLSEGCWVCLDRHKPSHNPQHYPGVQAVLGILLKVFHFF